MNITEEVAIAAIAAIEDGLAVALKKAHPSDIDMWRTITCDRIDGVMTLLSFMTPDADGEIPRSIAAGFEAQGRITQAQRAAATIRPTGCRTSARAGVLR